MLRDPPRSDQILWGGGIFPESSQTERVDSTLHLNLNIKMPEDSLEGGGGGGGGGGGF